MFALFRFIPVDFHVLLCLSYMLNQILNETCLDRFSHAILKLQDFVLQFYQNLLNSRIKFACIFSVRLELQQIITFGLRQSIKHRKIMLCLHCFIYLRHKQNICEKTNNTNKFAVSCSINQCRINLY